MRPSPAATFGMPVVFGPNYRKFHEAIELVELKAAFPVSNAIDFREILDRCLKDIQFLKQTSSIAATYVSDKAGATELVLSIIKSQLKI